MNDFVHLSCPSCDEPIETEHVNLTRALAKCAGCHAVFSIGNEVPPATRATERLRVELPKGIEVERKRRSIRISRRWFGYHAIFLLVFSLAWNGILLFWYRAVFIDNDADIMMILLPFVHVSAGIGIAYYTVALFFNRTNVSIARRELTIQHSPLPWPGNLTRSARSIKQLFCKRVVKRSKHSTYFRYEVHALNEAGGRRKLVANLMTEEQAVFIEQELEDFLQIEDEPVAGQVS